MQVLLLILLLTQSSVFGFWGTGKSPFGIANSISNKITINPIEEQLLTLLEGTEVQGRGKTASVESQQQIENLVNQLESSTLTSYTKKNVIKPIQSPLLDGCWKLIYTSSPGTNSPIQRTFTASDKVGIFQVIHLLDTKESFLTDSETNQPDVSNIVCFGDKARLRVTALASTIENPLVVPRKGDGKIFGLNIFGVSSNTPARDPLERVDFAFQDACFEFRDLPQFSIPYPVPFKLLGDEAKGWIDVTYLSSKLRLTRGNKGTLFILKKLSDDEINDDPSASLAVARLRSVDTKTSSTSSASSSTSISPTTTTIRSQEKQRSLSSTVKSSKSSETVAIIFPAQLGVQDDYLPLSQSILSRAQIPCFTPSLSRLDWPVGLLPSAFSTDYIAGTLKPRNALSFYFKKIDLAVQSAIEAHPDSSRIVLIGHSIGGWIARAWLSEWCTDESIKARVRVLLTLGSPHSPPPSESAVAALDQTRGLLTYINSNYPGAHEGSVKYISVGGTAVQGSLPTDSTTTDASILMKVESAVAFASYLFLCGDGKAIGDGIIPLSTSQLPGAQSIQIENCKHSNFVPKPGASALIPFIWYGSDSVIDTWLTPLLVALKGKENIASTSNNKMKLFPFSK